MTYFVLLVVFALMMTVPIFVTPSASKTLDFHILATRETANKKAAE